MVDLKHYDHTRTVRFVTFSCYRRFALLRDKTTVLPVLEAIDTVCRKHAMALLAYVVMPSHVHLVIYPRQQVALGRVVGQIKFRSGFEIIRRLKLTKSGELDKLKVSRNGKTAYAFWTRRCYDHNCRSLESVREKINYCHLNPVRSGLVADPVDYPWSSYRWYQGFKHGLPEVHDTAGLI